MAIRRTGADMGRSRKAPVIFSETFRQFEMHMRAVMDETGDKYYAQTMALLAMSLSNFKKLQIDPLEAKIRWLETPWYRRLWIRTRQRAQLLRYWREPVVAIEELAPDPPARPEVAPTNQEPSEQTG